MGHVNNHIEVITVPYDSGHFGQRMGAGPLHLLDHGLVKRLQEKSKTVSHQQMETAEAFNTEISTSFQLLHKIKSSVSQAFEKNSFPIVLSGNCNATVGTVAAYEENLPGVIWFDAHGDCETPESTTSGFFDGMAMAMLLGNCWRTKMKGLIQYPLPAESIVLIGARDVSEYELDFINHSGLHYLTVAHLRERPDLLRDCVNRLLKAGIKHLHLHLDADVFDPSIAPANAYSVAGGLFAPEIISTIKYFEKEIPFRSAGISAYDPSFDKDNKLLTEIFKVIDHLVADC